MGGAAESTGRSSPESGGAREQRGEGGRVARGAREKWGNGRGEAEDAFYSLKRVGESRSEVDMGRQPAGSGVST